MVPFEACVGFGAGIFSFWPTLTRLVLRLLAARNWLIVTLCALAILVSVSPGLTS